MFQNSRDGAVPSGGIFMLDLKYVRSNLERIKEMLKNRGYDLDLSRFETLAWTKGGETGLQN